jgi:hypothetical protein
VFITVSQQNAQSELKGIGGLEEDEEDEEDEENDRILSNSILYNRRKFRKRSILGFLNSDILIVDSAIAVIKGIFNLSAIKLDIPVSVPSSAVVKPWQILTPSVIYKIIITKYINF